MIMTANYKAREFGIRSGIPTFVGRRLCQHLVFRKPDFVKYREISAQFKDILLEIDPALESCGLDEANLDVTDYLIKNELNTDMGKLFLAERIRTQIREKT